MKEDIYLERNACYRCMKYIILVSNIIFVLIGCICTGVCIYLAVDKVSFVSIVIGSSLISTSVYLELAASSLIIIVSFLGCFGFLFQKKWILLLYIICLCCIFVLAVIGGVFAIIFRPWMTDQIRYYMRSTLLNNYGLEGNFNEMVTKSWDTAQQKWYCCAVEDESWGVYRSSEWYGIQSGIPEVSKPYVPESCCKKDQYGQHVHLTKCQKYQVGPPGRQSGLPNEAIFYRGCFVTGRDLLFKVSHQIIAIAATLAFIMIWAIVLSTWHFLLYRG